MITPKIKQMMSEVDKHISKKEMISKWQKEQK